MKTIVISFAFALLSVVCMAQCLTLEVRDIENVQGHLYVALYSSKESFMKKPVAAFRVEVKDKIVRIPCSELPIGMYAVSLFQDENDNGVLDTASFGRPIEKFGFSNDAEGVMGAPSFEKCCFEWKMEEATRVIHLK